MINDEPQVTNKKLSQISGEEPLCKMSLGTDGTSVIPILFQKKKFLALGTFDGMYIKKLKTLL